MKTQSHTLICVFNWPVCKFVFLSYWSSFINYLTLFSFDQVIVGGYDVRSSLSQAFEAMGYCPQHDALWEPITLEEHMECYALVRGIPRDRVKDVLAL